MFKVTTELESVHEAQNGLDNNFDSLPRNSSVYQSMSSDKRRTAPKTTKVSKIFKNAKESMFT